MSGPWTVRGISIVDAAGNRIGRAEVGFEPDGPVRAEANVKLMAMGPELLTQLEAAKAEVEALKAESADLREELRRSESETYDAMVEGSRLRDERELYKGWWEANSQTINSLHTEADKLTATVENYRAALDSVANASYPAHPLKEIARAALIKLGGAE